MKTLLLVMMIWVGSKLDSPAQSRTDAGDEQLGNVTMALMLNSRPDHLLFGSNWQKQLSRFDTMAQTGENLHQRAMFEHDTEKAIAMLEQCTQLDPKLHNTVGWSYLVEYRDFPRALHHLNAYDDLTPNFDDVDGMSPVSYLKGLCYRNMGNHVEAVRQFSKGIDSLAKKHGPEWVNYKHLVSRAVSYMALNQLGKALADLSAATENCTSDSPMILYFKGKLLQQQGQQIEARRIFQEAKFRWQANRVKGISQPEDDHNLVTESDLDDTLKQ